MGDQRPMVLLIGSEDEENLSIRYIASSLIENGYRAEIVPCSGYKHFPSILKKISRYRPKLIGISIAFQSFAEIYFKLIEKIRKEYEGHITLGGHFPTFEFGRILKTQMGVDSVIRFEGEKAIVELMGAITGNLPMSEVRNLVYRRGNKIFENKCYYEFPNLDGLPFPLRDKKPRIRLGERFATLLYSRGCWYASCLYCCIGAFHSRKREKLALRSPENVAKEISELYFGKGVRLFQFHDDNFLLSSEIDIITRIKSLKGSIENEGISTDDIAFLIKARPDCINEKIASELRDLGVVGCFLGIENASETGLRALIRGATLKDIKTAVSSLRKNEIIVTYNLLMFHPNATANEIEKNLDFVKENIDLPFDFGRAEVVSGSPLERMLSKEKRLKDKWPVYDYTIKDEIAEKMFRLNAITFRKSSYSRMVHMLIALSYHIYMLKKLYPGRVSTELKEETHKLISKINEFILEEIYGILDLAIKGNMVSQETGMRIHKKCNEFIKSIKRLDNKMLRLQIAENVFMHFGLENLAQEKLFRYIFLY